MIKWIKNLFKKRPVKYCVDCLYYKGSCIPCNSPHNKKPYGIDVVTGQKITNSNFRYGTCREARHMGIYTYETCGPKGLWFKPKKSEFNLKPCQLEPTTNKDAMIKKD